MLSQLLLSFARGGCRFSFVTQCFRASIITSCPSGFCVRKNRSERLAADFQGSPRLGQTPTGVSGEALVCFLTSSIPGPSRGAPAASPGHLSLCEDEGQGQQNCPELPDRFRIAFSWLLHAPGCSKPSAISQGPDTAGSDRSCSFPDCSVEGGLRSRSPQRCADVTPSASTFAPQTSQGSYRMNRFRPLSRARVNVVRSTGDSNELSRTLLYTDRVFMKLPCVSNTHLQS